MCDIIMQTFVMSLPAKAWPCLGLAAERPWLTLARWAISLFLCEKDVLPCWASNERFLSNWMGDHWPRAVATCSLMSGCGQSHKLMAGRAFV